MKYVRKNLIKIALGTLLLISIVVWYSLLSKESQGILTVAFLDVGQGDAIFIESPTGRQVLIDAGAGNEVLRALGSVMPFYDRSIDMVIATHADKDHIGGFPAVLKRFAVDAVVRTDNKSKSNIYREFNELTEKEQAQKLLLRTGSRIALGGGAYIEVLFPDRDVSEVESNTASIITRLIYGNTSFILTGDSPRSIEKYISGVFGSNLKSDVLKAGHHGSKTSTSKYFLNTVDPDYVVISAGKDNRYGHPNKEVMDLLRQTGTEILITYNEGNIVFESDGEKVVRK
ncbi:MAG TPA: MBL fold metallo-hydrolase [Candidatus Yonathbacteria bacterium]|nr:MBL fold metallo-hydrolase [Candidatus Yonathbacteria bacterium]